MLICCYTWKLHSAPLFPIFRYSTDGPVAALSELEGDTTAEKASAYIRELQSRRTQTYLEHRNSAAKGLGPEPEAQF